MAKQDDTLVHELKESQGRILRGYRKDKERWRRKERFYAIVVLVSTGLNVLLAIYGREAIPKLLEIVKEFWR